MAVHPGDALDTFGLDLSVRRAVLLRRRRASLMREWAGMLALTSLALWVGAIVLGTVFTK